MLLLGLVRKLGKNWWVWGAVVSVIMIAFAGLIAPVYILPLFNKFTKLQDAHIKDPILSLARANGIPATDVYEFDASRQSNRVSANVSGFANTMRISLNDNLLKRCTLPEIETTMGHEMGHYVLNHAYKGLILNGVVIVIGFAFANWGIGFALARWGEAWGVRGITDVAVLPLAVIVFSIYFFVTTPVGKHHHAHHGVRSGYVRLERRPPARRRSQRGPAAGRISQDGSRTCGGIYFLRSSERPHAHNRGDALEGRESGYRVAGRGGQADVWSEIGAAFHF